MEATIAFSTLQKFDDSSHFQMSHTFHITILLALSFWASDWF
jgi:hypothetical protein